MNISATAFSQGDFSLIISDIHPLDQGLYSCHLHHHYCGLHERRIFHLTVTPPVPQTPQIPQEPTDEPQYLPNEDPRLWNDINMVEVPPHVINVIMPEQRNHFLHQLGYILATLLLLALIVLAIVLLTRHRKRQGQDFDPRKVESPPLPTVTYVGHTSCVNKEYERSVQEVKSSNQEETKLDYKNNLLKEAEMSKFCSPKAIDLDRVDVCLTMKMFGLLSFLLLVLHTSADGSIPGLVKEIIHVEKEMSWYNARTYCLSNSGQTLVLSDKNNLKNLSSSANQLSWVGLYRDYATWYWVDETVSTYFNWFGKCASLEWTGYWYITACDKKLFFVCKNITGDFWVLVKENKTWQEAKQHCETNHAGLAIISNEKENNITRAVVETGSAWIGLATVQQDSHLKETWRLVGVNKSVTFSRWFSQLFCAVIDWRGFWHDRVCFEEHQFICFRHGNYSLELVNESKVWKEAQSHCKQLNMSLVIVKTEAELTALVVYIQSLHRSFVDNLYFWIGLYNNPWSWSDYQSMIQYWNRLQPDNLSFKNRTIAPAFQACGALKDGELFDESCNDPLPFFCMATVRSMILVSEPRSWLEALKHCRDKYVDLVSLSSAMEQVVKEEVSDDNAKLPCFNGRVVSWLVLAESSHTDGMSVCTDSHTELPPPLERTGGIGDSRPPSFHANAVNSRDGLDTETGSESVLRHRRERERERTRRRRDEFPRVNGHSKAERVVRDTAMACDSGSMMSSELESSSFIDSEEDEDASRLSSSTEQSSSFQLMKRHKRRRRRHKVAKIDRSSSFSSITDSTMSLNIITVTLNMEKYNFLGISIVGQSNDRGDGGIYIGSIMKGGAVAADGRIEPGDMLLQVNDVNFENMSNDDAVRILREIVSKNGPISLTVAKCWDPSPRSYFTIPRAEPVRPIDPAAWISHTTALTGSYPQNEFDDLPLTVGKTDMATIVKVMQLPDSGLEIRDRMWLKITIANAVIDMATLNLNEGSSGAGSEQDTLAPLPPPSTNPWPMGGQPFPYPPFSTAPSGFPPGYSDPCHSFHSGSAGSHHSEGSRSSSSNPSVGRSQRPVPRDKDRKSAGSGGSESDSGNRAGGRRVERSASQLSHRSHALSSRSHTHSRVPSQHSRTSFSYSHAPFSKYGHTSCALSERSHASSYGPPGLPPPYSLARLTPKGAISSGPPGAPPVREIGAIPPELTASRQSFQHAMGNPCEFFVDIM
ncbi:segment polarity dishevelled -like protein [Labeo rohita]|uniref:Segment polarity dishevelled-like protein n=1 Tax=Labeo rohita TaxID=84645 RepID=A0A498MH90_LABRO|nr:segment polarity dishevelled -like protein [Labeo rohita]